MKKFLVALAFASVAILSFGQNKSIIRPRMEIVKTETEVIGTFNTELEVFYMNDENPRMYYASLGNLGIGGNIVQLEFDPIFELFIPLGGTLEEAVAGQFSEAGEAVAGKVREISRKVKKEAMDPEGKVITLTIPEGLI